jgi:DNA-binding transcriptional ArsR family regulator
MLQALKAMADPTRLRILRYLTGKAMTPADLSRRLRLRPPTVVHHLHALRLAGLVHLTLETGGERRYAVRREMIGATFEDIQDFLKENK